jgi:hypothetical protein
MMNQKEWLERASTFNLGNCIIYNRPIEIRSREQMDNSIKWVLKMHEWVLGKDGEFHTEPMPSGRSDEFIENTRFNTPDECHSFWVENIKVEKPLYG